MEHRVPKIVLTTTAAKGAWVTIAQKNAQAKNAAQSAQATIAPQDAAALTAAQGAWGNIVLLDAAALWRTPNLKTICSSNCYNRSKIK